MQAHFDVTGKTSAAQSFVWSVSGLISARRAVGHLLVRNDQVGPGYDVSQRDVVGDQICVLRQVIFQDLQGRLDRGNGSCLFLQRSRQRVSLKSEIEMEM